VEGQARQAPEEGSRRALDGQVQQGEGARQWNEAGRRHHTIPTFGYQNHVSIDRAFGLIRGWNAGDAAAYEGARLREGLLDKTNTASVVWTGYAYRSKAN
jgi:hypothetical protein